MSTELRYGDKVRIKEGFYKDCFGIAIDYDEDYYMEVEINKADRNNCYRTKIITISVENIEKLETKK